MNSNFIQTRDLRMHYLQGGNGSLQRGAGNLQSGAGSLQSGAGNAQSATREPVIFIHGFPETSYEWRHQFAAFSSDYACFAPDTRGYGRTDKPGIRVTRALLAQDIVNFMDALGIEKAAVVAHDWGGIIGFKLAIDFPERVTRLALLDTLCTVWVPQGVHGYWFKAAPYPEELFAAYHKEFIETIFAGGPSRPMPGRPQSPWGSGGSKRWASDADLQEYTRAFADPMSHFHAISYYRYALPFHIVTPDASATHGERFQFLSEREVADMWLYPDGMEKHPLYDNYMDYGPEDRHKQFTRPALWMFGTGSAGGNGASAEASAPDAPRRVPKGNPFLEQFSRYFPDLRARGVAGGHFFPEENPEATNAVLREFLAGKT